MNPIALEAQVLRGLSPGDVVRAAARAGFDQAGVWIDRASWTGQTTRDTRRAFLETGVLPLDAEVIRIGRKIEDSQLWLIDIAGELSVPYVIAVGMDDDAGATPEILSQLSAYGAAAGVRIVLEFGMFTAIPTFAAAKAVVEAAQANIGILPDPLHLVRSGGMPVDLAGAPAGLIPFAQLCDAGPAPVLHTGARLLEEARHHRLDLGDGVLPLADFVAALPPGIPLSNEVRSRKMQVRYNDPIDHAAALAARMRHCLTIWEMRR